VIKVPAATVPTRTTQYCTYRLADHWFGVEARQVQEVLAGQELTPVPLAPPGIAGLLNIRGEIVTAVDLRARLGMPAADPGAERLAVVVRVDGEPVSLVVDGIGGIVDADPDAFEPAPPTMPAELRDQVIGAFTLPDILLLVVDTVRATAPS
jgi:purine-binding chemotaxis protein CheW